MCYRLIISVLLLSSGQVFSAELPETRTFWMGFTPFPYDITDAALIDTRESLRQNSDLVSNHLDEGIPWVEMLNGENVSGELLSEWQYRLALTEGKISLLSITPIDISRSQMAPYFSPSGVQSLPEPWASYAFDHPDVKSAYLNYARQAVAFFQPDYLVLGIEVNGLMKNSPQQWPGYLDLHRTVYQALKQAYPELPIMVSLTGMDLLQDATDANADDQAQALEQILPYTDYFALSLYPYMSAFTADIIPDDLFSRLRALSTKPMAITETGYIAEPLTVTFPDGPYTFSGSEAKQLEYMALLFQSAQAFDIRLVVNFVLRDYDRIWDLMGQGETLAIWRDTGIYDEAGNLRAAGQLWQQWLAADTRVSNRGSPFKPRTVPVNDPLMLGMFVLAMLASTLWFNTKRLFRAMD